MSIEDVLAAHTRGDWSDRTHTCQGCADRALAAADADESSTLTERRRLYAAASKPDWSLADYNSHLAAAITAHLLSPAVIARAGLTIWPDATHPDDRAWAEADARAAITAALEVES